MTLTANSAGVVSGRFTIPANIPVGSKAVAFVGAQGSRGTATFTGSGTVTTVVRRRVTTVTTTRYNVDPLAQTFTLDAGRHVAGVDLWFVAKGTHAVTVQIRETDGGFPGTSAIAEKTLVPADIVIGGNSTRVLFPAPVWLDAGIEYAIVVLTDDADTSLAVAELGKYDASASRWITGQPYQVGVLLSSSNASTWTAHQDKDLTFRLLGARFTSSTRTVPLGTVAVSGMSDMLALLDIETPATGARAEVIATAPDGTAYTLAPGTPVNLPSRVTGNLSLSLSLSGTATASPVVYPGVQFAEGSLSESAEYVSRTFSNGSNGRISVTLEALTPGTSTVAVAIKTAAGTWQTLTLTSGTPVGDGWVERSYVLTGFTATTTAVKITLTGSAGARPRVRALRAVATD